MSVDKGWIGDPESKPCEMGGGSLVDYGNSLGRLQHGTSHLYVTKASYNARLETIAQMMEHGPISANVGLALAIRIRGMKLS